MALNTGANQFTDPTFSAKACFIVAGDLTTIVNKGKRAGPMSGLINKMSMDWWKVKYFSRNWGWIKFKLQTGSLGMMPNLRRLKLNIDGGGKMVNDNFNLASLLADNAGLESLHLKLVDSAGTYTI